MGWADPFVTRLLANQPVRFRPYGNSMQPKIKSGQLVAVEPRPIEQVAVGDIVLCRVKGKQYLHYVKAVDAKVSRVLIANAAGHENGWTGVVYGVVTAIED